jgi:hypothetical protein
MLRLEHQRFGAYFLERVYVGISLVELDARPLLAG